MKHSKKQIKCLIFKLDPREFIKKLLESAYEEDKCRRRKEG